MKAQITFEVSEKKTEVTAVGLNGMADKFDITGTDVEKDFIKLLKKLQKHQLAIEVMEALDIDKWEVISDKK